MNDNTNKQIHKLKLLKLNTLLSNEYLKTKDSNKTERLTPNLSKNYILLIIQNLFYIHKIIFTLI